MISGSGYIPSANNSRLLDRVIPTDLDRTRTIMASPKPPRLLDQVREVARLRRFSLSTEKSYVHYIRNFILFHNKRHPKDMGAPEIRAYPQRLPVVFTRSEVKRILANLDGIQHLIVSLLYGAVLTPLLLPTLYRGRPRGAGR